MRQAAARRGSAVACCRVQTRTRAPRECGARRSPAAAQRRQLVVSTSEKMRGERCERHTKFLVSICSERNIERCSDDWFHEKLHARLDSKLLTRRHTPKDVSFAATSGLLQHRITSMRCEKSEHEGIQLREHTLYKQGNGRSYCKFTVLSVYEYASAVCRLQVCIKSSESW